MTNVLWMLLGGGCVVLGYFVQMAWYYRKPRYPRMSDSQRNLADRVVRDITRT